MGAHAWQARKPVSGLLRAGWLTPREERAIARDDRGTLRLLHSSGEPALRALWQPENRRERRRLRK